MSDDKFAAEEVKLSNQLDGSISFEKNGNPTRGDFGAIEQLHSTINDLSARLNDWHFYRLKATQLERAVELANHKNYVAEQRFANLKKKLDVAEKTANWHAADLTSQLGRLQARLAFQEEDIQFHRTVKELILKKLELANERLVEIDAMARFPVFQMLHSACLSYVRRVFRQSVPNSPEMDIEASKAALLQSGFFDEIWYNSQYPDVAAANFDPATHFLLHGADEFRNPGPDFDTRTYLHASPDVLLARINPVLHYVNYGRAEGRPIMPPGGQAKVEASKGLIAGPLGVPLPQTVDSVQLDSPAWLTLPRTYSASTVFQSVNYREAKKTFVEFENVTLDLIEIGKASQGGPVSADLAEHIAMFCWINGSSRFSRQQRAEILRIGEEWIVTDRHGPRSALYSNKRLWTHNVPLADIWMANDYTLRLRFESGQQSGFRIACWRGFQIDKDSGKFRSVGEKILPDGGLPTLVDLNLLNPYAPVLLVLGGEGDVILEVLTIPFPSLSRRAPHYGELLAQDGREVYLDVYQAYSTLLLERLDQPGWTPGASTIEVDLRGATGGERIFDPACLGWLSSQFEIAIVLLSDGLNSERRADFDWLISTIPAVDSQPCRTTKLRIPADSIPSLALLFGISDFMAAEDCSVILADAITASPHSIMTMPRSSIKLDQMAPPFAPVRPMLIALDTEYGGVTATDSDGNGLIAIRFLTSGEPKLAKLLAPISIDLGVEAVSSIILADQPPPEPNVSVVCCASSAPEHLLATIEALYLQDHVRILEVLVACDPEQAAETANILMRLVPRSGRLVLCEASTPDAERLQKACADARGDLLLVMSSGVILHDRRSLTLLTRLISHSPLLTSVSCLLVLDKLQPKHESPTLIGGAYFDEITGGLIDPAVITRALVSMPPALWPIFWPSAHLFMLRKESVSRYFVARSTCVKDSTTLELHEQAPSDGVLHGLTTAITATILVDDADAIVWNSQSSNFVKDLPPARDSLRFRKLLA